MATSGSWMQNPMPPGWASKYDQNAKKYFFIDHQTHKTQWVDPRIAYYANQPSPNLRPPGPPKCKTCKRTQVYAVGVECITCQSFAQRRNIELEQAKKKERAEKIRLQQAAFSAAEKKRKTEERIATRKKLEEEMRIKAEKKRQHEEQMAAESQSRHMYLLAQKQTPQPTQERPPGPPKCKTCKRTQVYAVGVECITCQSFAQRRNIELEQAKEKERAEKIRLQQAAFSAAEKKRKTEERIATRKKLEEEMRIKAEKKRQHEEQMAAESQSRHMYLLAQKQTPQPTQEKPPEQIALQRKGPPKCKRCHSIEVYAEGVECIVCQRMMRQAIDVAPTKKAMEQKEEERITAEKKRQQEERIAAEQQQRRGQSATQETTFIEEDKEIEVIPTLTMYQKVTMVNDLQVIYTDVSRSVIDMILESCSYKKEMARAILNSMSSKRAPPTTQASSSPIKSSPLVDQSKPATPKEPTPAQKTRGGSGTTTPVSKATTSTMATTATTSSTKSSVSASTHSKTAPKAAVVTKVTAARKPSPSSPKQAQEIQKFKKKRPVSETKRSEITFTHSTVAKGRDVNLAKGPNKDLLLTASRKPSLSSPKQAQEIRKVKKKLPVSETKRSDITFTHSTVAKGRDVNLAKGPNKDLLLTNYVRVGGHNAAITQGPNPANVSGPSGVSSKGSTLAKGPQAALRMGPQHRLGKVQFTRVIGRA